MCECASIKVLLKERISKNTSTSFTKNLTLAFLEHSCSNQLNWEMAAEFPTKNVSYLNLNISRTKNGRNKL